MKLINSNEKLMPWILMIGGGLITVFMFSLYYSVPQFFNKEEYGVVSLLIVLPFLTSTSVFVGWYQRKDYRYFGPTPIQLSPAIGQAGGQLGGTIKFNEYHSDALTVIKLICTQTFRPKNSEKDIIKCLWSDKQFLYVKENDKNMDFLFNIPTGQLTSGRHPLDASFSYIQSRLKGQVKWELHASGYLKNREFSRSWEVPVASGSRHSEIIIPESHKEAEYSQSRRAAEKSLDFKIEIKKLVDGIELISGSKDVVMNGLLFGIAGVAFSTVGLALLSKATRGHDDLIIIVSVLLFLGTVLLWSAFYTVFRRVICQLKKDTIHLRYQWFGRITSEKNKHWDSRTPVVINCRMFMNSSPPEERIHDLYVHYIDDKQIRRKLKIVENIKGVKVAEAVQREIQSTLNVSLIDELGA